MADRSQENHQEPLTEREREVVLELVREIVKEALIAQAAEKAQQRFIEGGREHWKAQVAFFNQMITVSGAALLATTALFAALRSPDTQDPQISSTFTALLVIAAIFFLTSAISSLISLFAASIQVTKFSWGEVPSREQADKHLISDFILHRFFSYFFFSLGLGTLIMTALMAGFLPLFSGS